MSWPILSGTPSDELPEVLATGRTDVEIIFVSMSARQAEGRDEEYMQWHGLDHGPEQFRLAGLRHSLRLVSTPACRAARLASQAPYDAVDHVMTYFFADDAALGPFGALSEALTGERRPLATPRIELGVYDVQGKVASPAAIAGADVIPWRPALGVYLIIERGAVSAASLADIEGVAGVWWHEGRQENTPFPADRRGLQITYCFLDDDPVDVAHGFQKPLLQRWEQEDLVPLLAAPFYVVVPFQWGRHLP